ncbi:hypothetical protein H6G91_33875 [Nostoc muscorum FACHB-395]|nr:hypothetical protein [Desmonostoc muscorum FACHB-395]
MIPFHEKSEADVRREALLHLSFLIANCVSVAGRSPLRIVNWYEALFTTEDIAIRSKARLLRMEKLKMASLVGENPGFDFLQQCWKDDPALQIVIKKLVAKCSQWGIAIVDGVLIGRDKITLSQNSVQLKRLLLDVVDQYFLAWILPSDQLFSENGDA